MKIKYTTVLTALVILALSPFVIVALYKLSKWVQSHLSWWMIAIVIVVCAMMFTAGLLIGMMTEAHNNEKLYLKMKGAVKE